MQYKIIPDIIEEQSVCQLPEMSTVLEASKQMLDCNVAAIAVIDEDGKLQGIVTERDLTRRVMAKGLDPRKTQIAQVMTRNPDTLAPGDMAADALELMQSRKYRHLPVVEDGRVLGMVSIRDLYAAVKKTLEKDIRETEAFVFGDRYGV